METGRELSQGGRKQRMYWPRRTVWMTTVPSCEKQSRKDVQHHSFSLCKDEYSGVCSYPRSRHSHVQLCADTDANHLVYVSIQHLNWFGIESHRAAALVTQGNWQVYVKFNAKWMIWIKNKYLLFQPAAESATPCSLCLWSQRWGGCHSGLLISRSQYLEDWGTKRIIRHLQTHIN